MFKHGGLILAISVLILPGCSGPKAAENEIAERLARAEAFYHAGDYTSALIECTDLARIDPLIPGLPGLERRIMTRVTEVRARAAAERAAIGPERMRVDLENKKEVPLTYGMRRLVRGETSPLRTAMTRMEETLRKRVTVSLDNVGLNQFIEQVGRSEDINIISDNIDDTSTMTLHAKEVPLSEILDYVSRNLGVAFYAGENIIWVTPAQATQSGIPMETRMYRLRKGLSGAELDSTTGKLNVEEAIGRFVPVPAGADLLFDRKAHVLIARNTRENLVRIEDLIETLDVCPPQVLIEARFISTSVSDLRELGIDWILNSPVAVTKKRVLSGGTPVSATKTQINPTAPDELAGFAPFATESEGLNFTYQGVLTDPLFQAVLHALETSGKARTLSVPKVTTINNSPASIRVGEDFRYFEEYDVQSVPTTVTTAGTQVYSSMLVPVGTPQKEELGITLNVTPSVGADLMSVVLKLVPEISEFVRYEEFEVGTSTSVSATTGTTGATTNATSLVKLPIFRRSKIETELVVDSGETVVMGGLITSIETKGQRRVPFFGSLPLIGQLFRHDTVEEIKQNLLIFVTATILSERGENLIPITDGTAGPPQAKAASVP